MSTFSGFLGLYQAFAGHLTTRRGWLKCRVCVLRRRQWTMRPWSGGTEPLTEGGGVNHRARTITHRSAGSFVFNRPVDTCAEFQPPQWTLIGTMKMKISAFPARSRRRLYVYAVWLMQSFVPRGFILATISHRQLCKHSSKNKSLRLPWLCKPVLC